MTTGLKDNTDSAVIAMVAERSDGSNKVPRRKRTGYLLSAAKTVLYPTAASTI